MNEDNRNIYAAIIKMAVKTARAITDDQEALAVKCLYKQWEKQIGRQLEVGEYIQHNKQLYRVLQQHIAQANWIPGEGTESLYVIIDKEHSGTIDDKIPWVANMECIEGKYYIEDDISYLCIRSSGIALQCKASEVVGNYFVVVDKNGKQEENENKDEGEGEEVKTPSTDENGEQPNEDEVVKPEEPNEEGTLENPIAYEVGVTPLENGKYYIENDVVYLCNRSEAVVYHNLSALVNLYVTVVE